MRCPVANAKIDEAPTTSRGSKTIDFVMMLLVPIEFGICDNSLNHSNSMLMFRISSVLVAKSWRLTSEERYNQRNADATLVCIDGLACSLHHCRVRTQAWTSSHKYYNHCCVFFLLSSNSAEARCCSGMLPPPITDYNTTHSKCAILPLLAPS